MPGSGIGALWNEAAPAETDVADAAPIRSIETSLRNILAVEHNFPSATGPNFGYHLLGSCRAFVDVESNVSSAGTDGRLMITSDTSRFFHVGSTGTMFLGGQNVISAGSQPPGGQKFYWAEEFGVVGALTNSQTITFPNSGFSGVPFIFVSIWTSVPGPANGEIYATVFSPTATTFITAMFQGGSFVSNSASSIFWRSIGTRVL